MILKQNFLIMNSVLPQDTLFRDYVVLNWPTEYTTFLPSINYPYYVSSGDSDLITESPFFCLSIHEKTLTPIIKQRLMEYPHLKVFLYRSNLYDMFRLFFIQKWPLYWSPEQFLRAPKIMMEQLSIVEKLWRFERSLMYWCETYFSNRPDAICIDYELLQTHPEQYFANTCHYLIPKNKIEEERRLGLLVWDANDISVIESSLHELSQRIQKTYGIHTYVKVLDTPTT